MRAQHVRIIVFIRALTSEECMGDCSFKKKICESAKRARADAWQCLVESWKRPSRVDEMMCQRFWQSTRVRKYQTGLRAVALLGGLTPVCDYSYQHRGPEQTTTILSRVFHGDK